MVTWTALPTARFPCFPCPQPAFLALAHGSESILLYLFALQLLDVDNDLQLVLKKIAKRDPVTKLKAMEELRTLLATKAPEDAAKTLPRWVCAGRHSTHPYPHPHPHPHPPRALCAPPAPPPPFAAARHLLTAPSVAWAAHSASSTRGSRWTTTGAYASPRAKCSASWPSASAAAWGRM